MRINFSALALATVVGLAATPASAQQRHWFYQDYDRYEDQAYYDDERYYDERDEYFAPSTPLHRLQRQRLRRQNLRKGRLRRWAKRNAVRRAQRRNTRRNRERLFDAWQNGQNGQYSQDDRYVAPRRQQASRPAPQKRLRLSYVPLPRSKPYHLIPTAPVIKTATNPQAGNRITIGTIGNGTKPADFDQRPVWKANPAKKPASKKDIEIASLPKAKIIKKATAPRGTKPKTLAPFQPIRIEVVKKPIKAKPRNPRKLTSNQLSCNKAKTIVSGFGFSDITARTCTGTVYDFNAKRDGKPYSVKVSSLSGELKGVKKIK